MTHTPNHEITHTDTEGINVNNRHTEYILPTLGEANPASALMLPPATVTIPTKVVQLDLSGGHTNVGSPAPSPITSAIPIGPAHSTCPECGDEVYPNPLSDPSRGWNLYPCCYSECAGCSEVSTNLCAECGEIADSCCSCTFCPHCDNIADDGICNICDGCSNCCECYSCANCGAKDQYGDYVCADCDCGLSDFCGCCGCYDQTVGGLTFVESNWHADIPQGDACARFREDYAQYVDPRQSMADFYLLDYIVAVLPTSTMGDRMHRVAYLDPNGDEYGERTLYVRNGDDLSQFDVNETLAQVRANGVASPLARTAATLQDHIVRICDDAFREYGFMAIGGEMRHEYGMRSVFPTHGRENTWGWVSAMGEKYGRVPMLEDFLRLCQEGKWDGGYGGKAWADCTKIVLMREKGDLDAKTFVDRCFALVHNSGCFIDKSAWGPLPYYPEKAHFVRIGDAHAADQIDFAVLVRFASDDVKGLLLALLDAKSNMPDSDRSRLARALGIVDEDDEDDENATEPDSVTMHGIVCTVSAGSTFVTCGAKNEDNYFCTGPVGHAHAHMAYYGFGKDAVPCSTTPWSDLPALTSEAPALTNPIYTTPFPGVPNHKYGFYSVLFGNIAHLAYTYLCEHGWAELAGTETNGEFSPHLPFIVAVHGINDNLNEGNDLDLEVLLACENLIMTHKAQAA